MNVGKRITAVVLAVAGMMTQTACKPEESSFSGDNTMVSVLCAEDVLITEAMASNDTVLQDAFGEYPDWLELYNTTDRTISLKGCYLSDDMDKKQQYLLPDLVLKPHSYEVVYASGRDTTAENGEIHTNFKLSAGEQIGLFQGEELLSSFSLPEDLPTDFSCGTVTGQTSVVYFGECTPGKANSTWYASALADLKDDTVPVILNEWMPKNKGVFYDEYGDCPDWVELRNLSEKAVDLTGFGLSDDVTDPMKWQFPSVTLEAGGYLLVLLSGRDVPYTEDSAYLHADFKLSDADGSLRLSNAKGVLVDHTEVISLPEGISHGKDTINTGEERFYTVPTPGKVNRNNGFASLESLLSASLERVYINEVCAVSSDQIRTLPDEDWIELYNNTPNDLNLAGWSFSKDVSDLQEYVFPAVTIPAYGYLVISAGDTVSHEQGKLNTGFKIGFTGDTLYLTNSEGTITDSFSTGYQRQTVTAGRVAKPDSLERAFFSVPTKGKENDLTSAAPAYALPVSIQAQTDTLTDTSHRVVLETRQKNGVIHYTLDGTEPTEESPLYTEPLVLEQSASLRAVVYAEGLLPSDVVTRTFLVEDPHTLGVVCLTCDPDDLFGYSRGIWANGPGWTSAFPHVGANYWKDWEREVYFEYYEPGGALGVAFSAGIKNHGQYSRAEAQKSVSVNLKEEYGSHQVHYPFFGENGLKEFENLLLRTGGQDWKYTNLVDAYCARVIEGQMDLDHMDEVPVAMYVNGAYWGMYYIREKINESYIYQHSGIPADDLDAIKGNNIVETGSYDGHKALLQYIRTHNLAVQENFDYIAAQMDVAEWTNYWITETFFGNTDTGNIRFYNSRSGNGKWRWILFDMDWALYPTTYQTNSIYQFIDPKGHGVGDSFSTTIAVNLMKNTDYKKYFVKTYAEYLHTVFETERMLGILDEMIAQVDGEMQRHCARWKNLSYNNWKKNTEQLRRIVDARWEICVDDLRTTFHLSNAEMAELFPELYG